MNGFISDSGFISAVLGLKDSSCSWNVNIITVLRISSNNYSLWALRTFHSKLIDFGWVKIINPSLNCIKPDSFSNHILTSIASNVKRGLVSNFISSNSLTFNYFEWFLFSSIAFFRFHFLNVIVFGEIEIVSSGCCKSAHSNEIFSE